MPPLVDEGAVLSTHNRSARLGNHAAEDLTSVFEVSNPSPSHVSINGSFAVVTVFWGVRRGSTEASFGQNQSTEVVLWHKS